MRLTPDELARLERMFVSGTVRSDPNTLSATDRMLDAMIAAAHASMSSSAHRCRSIRSGAPAERSKSRTSPADQSHSEVNPPTSDASSALQSDQATPHRLDDLIRVRRALLDDAERGA